MNTCRGTCGVLLTFDRDTFDRNVHRMHHARGYCSACYRAARRNGHLEDGHTGPGRPITELVEDIEWILGTDSPERIAARVGYPRMESLTRRLERNGRHDLARIFDQARSMARAS